MSDAATTSSHADPARWPWVFATIGAFSIFVVILLVAYAPKAPGPLPEGARSPEQRAALRAEVEAKQKAAYATYAWIDEKTGAVRLPVDRAMDLYLREQSAKR
jgi:hypothetical protein